MWLFLVQAWILTHMVEVGLASFMFLYIFRGSLDGLVLTLVALYWMCWNTSIRPSQRLWKWSLWGLLLLLLAKYVLATDIFCVCLASSKLTLQSFYGSGTCNPQSCSYDPKFQGTFILWLPFLSLVPYPVDESGRWTFFAWPFVTFFVVVLVRYVLRQRGEWNLHLQQHRPASADFAGGLKGEADETDMIAKKQKLKQKQAEMKGMDSARSRNRRSCFIVEQEEEEEEEEQEEEEEEEELAERWPIVVELRAEIEAETAKIAQWSAQLPSLDSLKRRSLPFRDFFWPGLAFSTLAILWMIIFYPLMFPSRNPRTGTTSLGGTTGAAGRGTQISGVFVVVLLILVLMAVVDRILYLKRWRGAKMALHFCIAAPFLLVLMPYFVSYNPQGPVSSDTNQGFFSANGHGGDPLGAKNPFGSCIPLAIFTIFELGYLALASKQIGYGYAPIRVRRPRFSGLRKILFVIGRSVPFGFEILILIDWSSTRTAMGIGDWMKLEDIYANAFKQKCSLSNPIGTPKSIAEKLLLGWALLALVLFLLFVPLIIYSSLNSSALVANHVQSAQIAVGFSGVSAGVYQQTTGAGAAVSVDAIVSADPQFESLRTGSWAVERVQFRNFSDADWSISAPSLVQLLAADTQVVFEMTTTFQRSGPSDNLNVQKLVQRVLDPQRKAELVALLSPSTNLNASYVFLSQLYDPVLHLPPYGALEDIAGSNALVDCYLGISPFVPLSAGGSTGRAPQYWSLYCADPFGLVGGQASVAPGAQSHTGIPSASPPSNSNPPAAGVSGPYYVVAMDDVLPNSSSAGNGLGVAVLQSYTLIAFYTTFVLLVGRLLRSAFTNSAQKIPVQDLPDPLPIIEMVLLIYEARELGNLKLEEDAYRELVQIYRLPDVLVTITRRPGSAPSTLADG